MGGGHAMQSVATGGFCAKVRRVPTSNRIFAARPTLRAAFRCSQCRGLRRKFRSNQWKAVPHNLGAAPPRVHSIWIDPSNMVS